MTGKTNLICHISARFFRIAHAYRTLLNRLFINSLQCLVILWSILQDFHAMFRGALARHRPLLLLFSMFRRFPYHGCSTFARMIPCHIIYTPSEAQTFSLLPGYSVFLAQKSPDFSEVKVPKFQDFIIVPNYSTQPAP